MDSVINVVVSQFKTFAGNGNDGSSNTLNKEEFSSLVASQLPSFVKINAGTIEQLMCSLDENNDRELTFLEFWQLIGKLANKQGGF
uniref:EF-hand domain-containing protein n=1 Tax=Salmo trutta TaxID=8032 RepID=A0A674DDN3_SALTR